ncbi:MAG: hypothetical protein ACE5J3_14650 [Methanosarcinales archaeon]
MTLRYRLFNIPGNLEECVDKLKKKGISEVVIHASERSGDSDPLGGFGDPSYILVGSVSPTLCDNLYFQKKGISDNRLVEKVKKWKDYLTSQGLKVAETQIRLNFKEFSLTEDMELLLEDC